MDSVYSLESVEKVDPVDNVESMEKSAGIYGISTGYLWSIWRGTGELMNWKRVEVVALVWWFGDIFSGATPALLKAIKIFHS
ncbi:hypothetical protein [Algoriphagus hitonicola]|nr:hypothetical protein [Algoriphagus hitonicola]